MVITRVVAYTGFTADANIDSDTSYARTGSPMNTRANAIIVRKRKSLGLSDEDVATRCNLSIYEYGDIESHADELITNISLATVRRICTTLQLQLSDLLAAENISAVPDNTHHPGRSRSDLLRHTRLALGKTMGEIAEAIGFDAAAIEKGEIEDSYLETLPIQVLIDWAALLRLRVSSVLNPI